ncbi:MAG: phenylacetate--CoA ligase [Deferrisomatales bacterium]
MDPARWPPVYDDSYLPSPDEPYWFRSLETLDPREREALILAKLGPQLRWAYERSPFYRAKWDAAGVQVDRIRSLDDFRRLPFVTKEELRREQAEHPPFGSYLCVPEEEVVRVHGTSGTTGRPTAFGIGRDDWARIRNAHARVLWGAGVRPSDTIFIGSFFSLYLGSWGALAGGERLGARCFPFGAGVPGQTRMALGWMKEMQPTVFYGTPSYALHIAEVARQHGYDPRRDFSFRILFFSGEPGAGIPATKRLIEETFGGACVDMGSTAEMTPWMSNAECAHRTGMHLWNDLVYTEVVDPETGEPVPYGGEGALVYTHLERTSQPMIRFWSGDRTVWTDEPCPCGRTYPRLPRGIYGRVDDMLVIRGENVYPSAVEDVLRAAEGFGGEFRLVVTRESTMDELTVQAEYDGELARRAEADPQVLDRFRETLVDDLRAKIGVRPQVELLAPGTLERTEFKARRVVDRRRLFEES